MTFLKDASSVVHEILLQEGNATEHLSDQDEELLGKVIHIIETDMYGNMRSTRKRDTTDLLNRLEAILECNANIETRQSSGDIGGEQEQSIRFQTELNELWKDVCDKTVVNNTRWEFFFGYMQTMSEPGACPDWPDPKGMAQLDVYFESSSYSAWWTFTGNQYKEPRDDWFAADQELREAIKEFNKQQAMLTTKLNDYTALLEFGCKEFDRCYNKAAEYYTATVSAVKARVAKNLEIVEAAETLLAHVKFLLAQQKTRDPRDYDKTEWQLTFDDVPDKTLCDLTTLNSPIWITYTLGECDKPIAQETKGDQMS